MRSTRSQAAATSAPEVSPSTFTPRQPIRALKVTKNSHPKGKKATKAKPKASTKAKPSKINETKAPKATKARAPEIKPEKVSDSWSTSASDSHSSETSSIEVSSMISVPRTKPKKTLEDMITSFLKEQSKRSRVHKPHHKSHSHKRGHRHRHSSESYLSDSEIGDGPRVSFLHDQGSKPFLKLHERYRAVNIKFFKRIYYGTFQPEHLTKLAHTFTNRSIDSRSKTKDEDVPEAIDLNQLIRCFCVYTAAVCHFAHSNVAVKLFQAFLDFRIKLSDWSIIYTFDTIREYLYAFMSARIAQGQDDPTAWEKEDQVLRRDILVRKDPFTSTKLTEDSNIL